MGLQEERQQETKILSCFFGVVCIKKKKKKAVNSRRSKWHHSPVFIADMPHCLFNIILKQSYFPQSSVRVAVWEAPLCLRNWDILSPSVCFCVFFFLYALSISTIPAFHTSLFKRPNSHLCEHVDIYTYIRENINICIWYKALFLLCQFRWFGRPVFW